jgi:hypothetical protein
MIKAFKPHPDYLSKIKSNLQRLRDHIDYPFSNFEHDVVHLALLKAFLEQFFRLNCDSYAWKPIDWSWACDDGIVMIENCGNHAVKILIRINDYNGLLYQPHDEYDESNDNKYFLPFDCWLEDICDSYGKTKYTCLTICTDLSEKSIEFSSKAIKVFTSLANPEKKIQQMIDNYYQELNHKGFEKISISCWTYQKKKIARIK